MTDKATVTIPSGVDGRVINTHGEVGETVAVGCELVSFDLSSKAFEPAAVEETTNGNGKRERSSPRLRPTVRRPCRWCNAWRAASATRGRDGHRSES